MYANLVTVTALLAAATSVHAFGKAIVKSQCSYPVYLWSVSDTVGEMKTLQTGEQYSEEYRSNPNGGGISIKLSSVDNGLFSGAAITQFEYTLDTTIWYDISNVNGYPFVAQGLTLVPSESSCPSVVCAAGVQLCSSVYNIPTDDFATADCACTADTVLVLCSDQVASVPAYSVSSVASVAIASASRTSAATTTTSSKPSGSSSVSKVSSSSVSAFSNPFVSVSVSPQSSTTFIIIATATTSATPVAIVSAQATSISNSAVYTTLVTHIVTVGGASSSISTTHTSVSSSTTKASSSSSIKSSSIKASSTTTKVSSTTTVAPSTTAAPTSTSTSEHWWIGHHPITWNGKKERRHMHHRHAEHNA